MYGYIAQSVEHSAVNRRVVGSSPTESVWVSPPKDTSHKLPLSREFLSSIKRWHQRSKTWLITQIVCLAIGTDGNC